ncbi:MAG: type I glutamate--ammonia ligase [Hadesarchaea archaeon CG08_land_8_20_14_0_20_51_8]|nr:MAG: type I glutamate--ammonia ligase [Hadesarchaea archaeon CG08_land_8_20_14_0_20_51_8]
MKTKVLKTVEKEEVNFIQMQFMDILGTVKNVTIPITQLEKALDEGVFFDGSSVLGYATIEESDMRLMPDPKTFTILPWTQDSLKTARLVCDVYDHEGTRFDGDPRYTLQKLVETVKKMGYVFNTAPEYEFFFMMLDENGDPTTKPSDFGGYFDLMQDRGDNVRKEIVTYLDAMGFEVEASHHEVAPGQHEIDLKYIDAISSADRVAMMKYVTKTIAYKHDLYATFMPKPIFGINGSGMHVHQSLVTTDGKSVFYDPKGDYQLSKNALYFIGGLLKYAKDICAILASSVNSYKRLVPGYEAPVYISWANRNRSAYIRVPAGRGPKTRIELRNPDPAGNPYLQFSVMLAAGLEGIKNKIMPLEPVEKDIFHMSVEERKASGIDSLPENLGQALDCMRESEMMRKALGDHLFEHFLHIKGKEWQAYRAQVMDWEIKNLLPAL